MVQYCFAVHFGALKGELETPRQRTGTKMFRYVVSVVLLWFVPRGRLHLMLSPVLHVNPCISQCQINM